jgi:HAD superfamily hydrolase (TIGR01509 family)
MDGVLVDSGDLHRRAWRVFLARKGKPITDEIFKLGFGRPNDQVLPGLFGRELSREQIVRLSGEKEACYRDLVTREGIQPTPGALSWLARFREAGVHQALATSGCRANADLIVDLTGARAFLEAIVTSEDVPRGKPHPDLFLRAAELLGVPPSRCLVIEDSAYGVQAARGAGIRCLALATTHPANQIDGADMVLDDMRAFSWAAWRQLFDSQAET